MSKRELGTCNRYEMARRRDYWQDRVDKLESYVRVIDRVADSREKRIEKLEQKIGRLICQIEPTEVHNHFLVDRIGTLNRNLDIYRQRYELEAKT